MQCLSVTSSLAHRGEKGTSINQDTRFSDKELKELKKTKFPPEFEQKV